MQRYEAESDLVRKRMAAAARHRQPKLRDKPLIHAHTCLNISD